MNRIVIKDGKKTISKCGAKYIDRVETDKNYTVEIAAPERVKKNRVEYEHTGGGLPLEYNDTNEVNDNEQEN